MFNIFSFLNNNNFTKKKKLTDNVSVNNFKNGVSLNDSTTFVQTDNLNISRKPVSISKYAESLSDKENVVDNENIVQAETTIPGFVDFHKSYITIPEKNWFEIPKHDFIDISYTDFILIDDDNLFNYDIDVEEHKYVGNFGKDTVIAGENYNKLYFDEGTELKFTRSGNDIIIQKDKDNYVTVKDYLNGEQYVTYQVGDDGDELEITDDIVFEYGKETSKSQILKGCTEDVYFNLREKFKGGLGNDTMYGGSGENEYIFTGNFGKDTIIAGENYNKLYFDEGTELKFTRSGNDIIIQKDKDNYVTVKDYLNGEQYVTYQVGDDGNELEITDDIVFEYGKETSKSQILKGCTEDVYFYLREKFKGGLGNDTIYGGIGENEYIFTGNFGKDTIIAGGYYNKLYFDEGTELKFTRSGNDIIIQKDKDNYVTVKDYLNGEQYVTYQVGDDGDELEITNDIVFEYGKETSKSQILKGCTEDVYFNLREKFKGGLGNDTIYGGIGENEYVFSGKYGKDTVYLSEYGNNKFIFDENAELSYERQGDDYIITSCIDGVKNGQVILKNYIDLGVGFETNLDDEYHFYEEDWSYENSDFEANDDMIQFYVEDWNIKIQDDMISMPSASYLEHSNQVFVPEYVSCDYMKYQAHC